MISCHECTNGFDHSATSPDLSAKRQPTYLWPLTTDFRSFVHSWQQQPRQPPFAFHSCIRGNIIRASLHSPFIRAFVATSSAPASIRLSFVHSWQHHSRQPPFAFHSCIRGNNNRASLHSLFIRVFVATSSAPASIIRLSIVHSWQHHPRQPPFAFHSCIRGKQMRA